MKRHLTEKLLEYHSSFLILGGIRKPVIRIIKALALSLIVRKDFRELTRAIFPTPTIHTLEAYLSS